MMLIRTEIKPSSAFILFNFSPAGMMLITRRKKNLHRVLFLEFFHPCWDDVSVSSSTHFEYSFFSLTAKFWEGWVGFPKWAAWTGPQKKLQLQ
jgi:hypothetical protein